MTGSSVPTILENAVGRDFSRPLQHMYSEPNWTMFNANQSISKRHRYAYLYVRVGRHMSSLFQWLSFIMCDTAHENSCRDRDVITSCDRDRVYNHFSTTIAIDSAITIQLWSWSRLRSIFNLRLWLSLQPLSNFDRDCVRGHYPPYPTSIVIESSVVSGTYACEFVAVPGK